MPRRYTPRENEPLSLRTVPESSQWTAQQRHLVGALVMALIHSGASVYLRLFERTQEYSLKIYVGSDSYQDVLRPQDDIAYLCGDYAEKLGALDEFKRIYQDWDLADAASAVLPAARPGRKGATPGGGA